MSKIKAAFFNQNVSFHAGEVLDYVYAKGRRQQVEDMTDMLPIVVSKDNFSDHIADLAEVEAVFST